MASDSLILSGNLGTYTVNSSEKDISENLELTAGKVDGTKSFYVVFRQINFQESNWDSYCSKLIDSANETQLGFVARSAHGYDKKGITVFEHGYYCGTFETYVASNPDITPSFPGGNKGSGVSSFIVWDGVWALFTGKNYKDIQIEIDGKKEFGPGCRIEFMNADNDLTKSVERIRDH